MEYNSANGYLAIRSKFLKSKLYENFMLPAIRSLLLILCNFRPIKSYWTHIVHILVFAIVMLMKFEVFNFAAQWIVEHYSLCHEKCLLTSEWNESRNNETCPFSYGELLVFWNGWPILFSFFSEKNITSDDLRLPHGGSFSPSYPSQISFKIWIMRPINPVKWISTLLK